MSLQDHIYIWPGTEDLVPSVTTILRVIDKPDLDQWRVTQAVMLARENKQADFDEIKEIISQAANYRGTIGTGVHECIGAYHTGQPMPDAYAFPEVRLRTDNYVNWAMENLADQPQFVEEVGFAEMDGLRFGGRPDAGFVTLKVGTYVSINGTGQKLKNNLTALLDFKTGKLTQPEWQLQLTGYKQIVMQTFKMNPQVLASARIDEAGVHVKVWDLAYAEWQATLRLWYWKFGPAYLEKAMRNGE